MSPEQAVELLRSLLGDASLPRPFEYLAAALGKAAAPARAGATRRRIEAIAAADNPLHEALRLDADFAIAAELRTRASNTIGQLVLGTLAERAFEKIYKETLGTSELKLLDLRESRNDTDYRVLNGEGRQVFRINIKFHGTLFRQARELVGLAPDDCFALATYKINQGLEKHEREALPYLFIVVSCPIRAADVAAEIPQNLVDLACYIHAPRVFPGRRPLEERIVARLVDAPPETFAPRIASLSERLSKSPWRVLSARRANKLLREKLFERVFAVRVRSFTRSYRNAEVDMHFSLSTDMLSLQAFLVQMKDTGLHGVATRIERGDI